MNVTNESRSSARRMGIVAGASLALFTLIGFTFWHEDLRYSLPTHRPETLQEPPLGTVLPVGEWLAEAGLDASGRPVLVHFFNPDCPCSRFNVDHLRKLHARFGDRVFFVAAIQARRTDPGLEDKLEKLALGIPAFLDHGGRRAADAGVYSTPQAIVVETTGRLTYRGNYNTSRYCTDPRTEFVRLALEHLVGGAPTPRSTPAYGCELPSAGELLVSQANPTIDDLTTRREEGP